MRICFVFCRCVHFLTCNVVIDCCQAQHSGAEQNVFSCLLSERQPLRCPNSSPTHHKHHNTLPGRQDQLYMQHTTAQLFHSHNTAHGLASYLPTYQQCRQAAGHTTAYSSSLLSLKKHAGTAPKPLPSVGKATFQLPLHLPIAVHHRNTLHCCDCQDQGAVHATHDCTATGVHAAKQYLGCNTLQPSTHQAAKVKAATLQHSRFPGDHSAEY